MSKHLRSLHGITLEPGYQRARRAAMLREKAGGGEDGYDSGGGPAATSDIEQHPPPPRAADHPPKPAAGGSAAGGTKLRRLAPAPTRSPGGSRAAGDASAAVGDVADDGELMQDPDIAAVLPGIRARGADQFWTTTIDDLAAVKVVRGQYPRERAGGKKKRGTAAAVAAPPGTDSEDSFDEGAGGAFDDEPQPVGNVVDPDSGEFVPVVGRSRAQVKYITAKVKLMLVDEENHMRKQELKEIMQEAERLGLAV